MKHFIFLLLVSRITVIFSNQEMVTISDYVTVALCSHLLTIYLEDILPLIKFLVCLKTVILMVRRKKKT